MYVGPYLKTTYIIEGFVLLKYCLSEISNIVLTNTSLKRRVRRLMHTHTEGVCTNHPNDRAGRIVQCFHPGYTSVVDFF